MGILSNSVFTALVDIGVSYSADASTCICASYSAHNKQKKNTRFGLNMEQNDLLLKDSVLSTWEIIQFPGTNMLTNPLIGSYMVNSSVIFKAAN